MTLENPYFLSSPCDEPLQDIDRLCRNKYAIRGHGKAQHGMNGKDADLDSGGQLIVKELETLDPVGASSMVVRIHLRQYANICEPYIEQNENESDEDFEARIQNAMDIATEIVCGELRYVGEWTGSDYWCFSNELHIDVPISVEDYESVSYEDEDTIHHLCCEFADAIYGHKKLEEFEKAMSELSRSINGIEN